MAAQHLSPLDKEGAVRCYTHNLAAIIRTSHTVNNPDREFYCCPLPQSERCDFFLWKDYLPVTDETSADHSLPAQPFPSTPPRPSNRTRFLPLATPTSNQAQRTAWPSSPTKRSSTATDDKARQKRFKSIQNALVTSPSTPGSTHMNVDPSPHTHQSSSTHAIMQPSTPQSARVHRLSHQIKEALSTPQPPSPHAVKRSSERSSTPTPMGGNIYRLQDLGFNIGDKITAISVKQESSPKEHEMDGGDDGKSEDELWSALTPPSSDAEPHRGDSFVDLGIQEGKGKQKEEGGREDSDSDDEADWLKDVLPQASSSSYLSTQSPSPSSPLSGNKIKRLLDELSDIPQYLQKLERKLAAMEKSNASKVQRIRELEEYIATLQR